MAVIKFRSGIGTLGWEDNKACIRCHIANTPFKFSPVAPVGVFFFIPKGNDEDVAEASVAKAMECDLALLSLYITGENGRALGVKKPEESFFKVWID